MTAFGNDEPFDVIVLGAGIMGALSAFELSKHGSRVALLEKNRISTGASGNSAAMLELQLDAHRGEPFFSLAKASAALFPSLSKEILSLTQIDIQLDGCGILQLACRPEEADSLRKEIERQKKMGLSARWMEPSEIKKTLPQLSLTHFGAAFFAEDGQVNGSQFLQGALKAAEKSGAKVIESAGFSEFVVESGVIKGIKTPQGVLTAPVFVIAAGAWTDELLKQIGVRLGIEPVRGQLAVYETPTPVFPFPVYTQQDGYIAPKKDGTTLAGTTVEQAGFDTTPTEEGKQKVVSHAVSLISKFKNIPIRKMIAGLRPKSASHLPVIGPLPDHPNVVIAAGHYRNGILLAPITARIVAALVHKDPLPVDIAPFSPASLLSKI